MKKLILSPVMKKNLHTKTQPGRLAALAAMTLLALAMAWPGNALAVNSTFNPNVNNDWFTPGNWSAGVPDASADIWATIQTGTANITNVATAGATNNNIALLIVNSGATLNILPGGSLTVSTNGYGAGTSRVLGTMNVGGNFDAGSTLQVSRDAVGSLLSITAGTTSVRNLTISIQGSNNTNSVSGKVEVSGSGNLTIEQSMIIGNRASGTGTVTGELTILSGATGEVRFGADNASANITVGNVSNSTGIINIHGGKLVGGDRGRIAVAANASAIGTINQTGGTLDVKGTGNASAGQLGLNGVGVGTYNLSGGTLHVRDILLGSADGTTDTFAVSGTNATLTVDRNFAMDTDGVYAAKLDLNGVSAMTVNGAVTLSGELQLSLDAFSLDFDKDVLLIDKTSVGAVSGIFGSLTNGSLVFAEYSPGQGYQFNIWYDWGAGGAGTGNDVMLQFNQAIPEPSTATLVFCGAALALWHLRRRR